LLFMRTFKPFQSFRTEDDKNLWLKRRDVFSKALPYFHKQERCLAVLMFDADLTGIAIKPKKLASLLEVSPAYMYDLVSKMENRCFKLMADNKI